MHLPFASDLLLSLSASPPSFSPLLPTTPPTRLGLVPVQIEHQQPACDPFPSFITQGTQGGLIGPVRGLVDYGDRFRGLSVLF